MLSLVAEARRQASVPISSTPRQRDGRLELAKLAQRLPALLVAT